MSEQTPVSQPIYSLLPTDVEGFDSLAELALDMRWSWNHATDEVWRQLDPVLWELTHHPWVVLQTVSRDKVRARAGRSGLPQEDRCPGAVQEASGGGARVVSASIIRRLP